MPVDFPRLATLSALSRKALWLSSWIIHHANHIRPKYGRPRRSAVIRPRPPRSRPSCRHCISTCCGREDRVAVKPHASPVFHAIQYLFGRQTREKLENLRGFKGAQSYPSRTEAVDDVDFSTGSVGLGVAPTLFASLVQDYVKAHGWMKDRREGRMIALRRRCRDGRGQYLRGACRGLEARPAQHLVGGRLQPPVARRRRARRSLGKVRDHVPQFRLGRGDREIRPPDARGVCGSRRRGAEALDRQLPERALRRAVLPGRRRLPQASARRDRRPGADHQADRPAQRRGAAGADVQSRRPRHGEPAGGVPDPSITIARSASSPTPSRASACRSRATRTTTPA